MSNICFIIGAGDIGKCTYTAKKDDFVICADGGYKYSEILGRHCNIVVGDFDSLGVIPDFNNKIVLPCEKDETDMDIAVEEGMKRGYRTFVIFGGLGGERLDHSFANIQLLNKIASEGARGFLVQDKKIFTCVKNTSLVFSEKCKGYISVFSFTDKSENVTLKNLKYKLENAALFSNRPMGVSNEFIGEKAVVSVENGTLLLYWHGSIYDVIK